MTGPCARCDKILSLLALTPGLSISELERHVGGITHSTISYHVERLMLAGAVSTKRDGRAVRCYPGAAAGNPQIVGNVMFRTARTLAIARIVRDRPNMVPFRIAHELGVSVPTVMWHLERLRDAGVISMQRDGRQWNLAVVPGVVVP